MGKLMMKRIVFLVLIVALCGVSAYAKKFTLTINDGSGGGKFKKKSVVHIWANPNPLGLVFDRWTGDTDNLADPFAAHTTLTLKAPVTLTATYKGAPEWTPTLTIINGSRVLYYFPESHIGVVFRFHGSGGNATSLFDKVEDRIFARDVVAAGFALISMDSANRDDKQWDNRNPAETNADIQNVAATLAEFKANGLIRADEPIFGVGISNGGAFVSRVSYALNFKAAAMYISAGQQGAMSVTTVSAIWGLAQNDSDESSARAKENYDNLTSRGVPASLNINQPSPVYSRRFWRIPGFEATDSEAIYAALKNGGFLDDSDLLKEDPNNGKWATVIPAQYTSYLKDIADQLDVCYTAHKFYSDLDSKIIAFFKERIQ